MQRQDIGAVRALFDELDAAHSERLPRLFRRLDRSPRDEPMFEALLSNQRVAIFVADVGKVVGFVHVELREAPVFPVFVPQARGLIENVYVAPDWRRVGLANQLIRCAEAWALQHGAVGMDLSVYEFNEPARALFAALGYSTLSRRMSKND